MLFHFGGRDQVQDPVPKMTRAFQSLFGWSSLSVCQTQHLTIRGSGRSRADASQKLHAPVWQLRRKVQFVPAICTFHATVIIPNFAQISFSTSHCIPRIRSLHNKPFPDNLNMYVSTLSFRSCGSQVL